MSNDSGDQGSSAGGSGDSVSRDIPSVSNCSITPSIASLRGEGVNPSAPAEWGFGEGARGVWYPWGCGGSLYDMLDLPELSLVRRLRWGGGAGGGGDSLSAPGL